MPRSVRATRVATGHWKLLLNALKQPNTNDSKMNDTEETYPMPALGWTCFHCGETFTTTADARTHFGTTQTSAPGCQIKAGHERTLLAELRRAEDAREKSEAEKNLLEMQLEASRGIEQRVLRLVPGARSVHDIWCHLDSMYNRILAAESVVGEIEKTNFDLVQAAYVASSGPGTYYPIGECIPAQRPGPKPAPQLLLAVEFDEALFEEWWERSGQYCRAGGGAYEQTFAYRAWEAALKMVAEKVAALLQQQADSPAAAADAQVAARLEKLTATIRWVSHVMTAMRPSVKSFEHASLDRARADLLELLNVFSGHTSSAVAGQ